MKKIALIIVLLLSFNKSVYCQNEAEETAKLSSLIAAYEHNDLVTLDEVIDSGVNLNAALHAASLRKYSPLVKKLLESGADPNSKIKTGETILISSIINDANEETIKLLIDAGANVNQPITTGLTPLMFSSSHHTPSQLKIMKLLINAGAELDVQDKQGYSAIKYAVHSNSYNSNKRVKLLLDSGANINLQDNEGKTVLMVAIEKKLVVRLGQIQLLLLS